MVTFLLMDYKNIHYALIENVQHLISQENTVYGKTFEGENFCGFCDFLANRESFSHESFAVYST